MSNLTIMPFKKKVLRRRTTLCIRTTWYLKNLMRMAQCLMKTQPQEAVITSSKELNSISSRCFTTKKTILSPQVFILSNNYSKSSNILRKMTV